MEAITVDDLNEIFKNIEHDKNKSLSEDQRIIKSFQEWVADQQMRGVLANPDKSNFKEWLASEHPQKEKAYKKLWDKMTSEGHR